MATIASENLLKAILELNENGEEVIAARLAEFLRISSAAVSMALKRLQKKGHLRISNKRSIHLTPEGFRTASALVRRHRLAERLLTDILHMPWEKVHDEAEKLEHAISPELEKRLLAGAVLLRPHFPNHGGVDDRRTMDAAEASRIELLHQSCHGARQQVISAGGVQLHILIGGLDPVDVRRHPIN